jgi:DNA-binding MarR family transcriptional regulator
MLSLRWKDLSDAARRKSAMIHAAYCTRHELYARCKLAAVERAAQAITDPNAVGASACAAGPADPGACAATSPADPVLDIPSALVKLSHLVQAIQARVAGHHDLTPVQAKLLCLLLGGPRGMADLAQALRVEKAALTGLMDRVERRGLAQRCAKPGDRRSLQVILTDLGRGTARAFQLEATAELARLTDTLSADDTDHFLATLAEIVHRNASGSACDPQSR